MNSLSAASQKAFTGVAVFVVKAVVSVAVWLMVAVLMVFLVRDHTSYGVHTYAPGEQPSQLFFSVAVAPGTSGRPFDTIEWKDVAKYQGSFLLPKRKDRYETREDQTRLVEYTVLEDYGTEQLIEVATHDGDYDRWYVYRATAAKVVPVSSRILGFPLAFVALPVGLVGTWLFWIIVGQLRARYGRRARPHEATPDARV